MYIASNSQPEIQFYFHKCDIFTHNYRASHEDAIICTYRYLKETQKKGIIIIPTIKLRVNCYVDYEFTGLLPYRYHNNSVCARSRSWYVVTFDNCPILWVSKHQTDIALYTLHA